MLDTLPEFTGFIKLLAGSLVFLITGAVVILAILERLIGDKYCCMCKNQILDEVTKYHDKIKEK